METDRCDKEKLREWSDRAILRRDLASVLAYIRALPDDEYRAFNACAAKKAQP